MIMRRIIEMENSRCEPGVRLSCLDGSRVARCDLMFLTCRSGAVVSSAY